MININIPSSENNDTKLIIVEEQLLKCTIVHKHFSVNLELNKANDTDGGKFFLEKYEECSKLDLNESIHIPNEEKLRKEREYKYNQNRIKNIQISDKEIIFVTAVQLENISGKSIISKGNKTIFAASIPINDKKLILILFRHTLSIYCLKNNYYVELATIRNIFDTIDYINEYCKISMQSCIHNNEIFATIILKGNVYLWTMRYLYSLSPGEYCCFVQDKEKLLILDTIFCNPEQTKISNYNIVTKCFEKEWILDGYWKGILYFKNDMYICWSEEECKLITLYDNGKLEIKLDIFNTYSTIDCINEVKLNMNTIGIRTKKMIKVFTFDFDYERNDYISIPVFDHNIITFDRNIQWDLISNNISISSN